MYNISDDVYEPTSPTFVSATLRFFFGGSSDFSFSFSDSTGAEALPLSLGPGSASASEVEVLAGVSDGSLLFMGIVGVTMGEAKGSDTDGKEGVVAGVRDDVVSGTECWCAMDWNWSVCC